MGNVLSGRSAWCRKRGEKWKVFVFSFLFEAELFVFTANELAWHRIGEKFAALLFKFVIGVEVELSHKFLTYHALAFRQHTNFDNWIFLAPCYIVNSVDRDLWEEIQQMVRPRNKRLEMGSKPFLSDDLLSSALVVWPPFNQAEI